MKIKTTGIGSLPHLNVQKAVNYSSRHSMPFLPQLTNLNERMIQQALEFNKVEKNHSALYPFIEMLLDKNISEFKIQIAGPSTTNANHVEILKTINVFLEIFYKYNLQPIVFIDEPIFNIQNLELSKIFSTLVCLKLKTGVHSCSKINLSEFTSLECDYFSYDLNLASVKKLNNSKFIICGIDPILNASINCEYDYLSYTCGLAKFTEIECEEILEKLSFLK